LISTKTSAGENYVTYSSLELADVPDVVQVDPRVPPSIATDASSRRRRHRIAGLSWQGGRVAPARLALFSFSGSARTKGLLELTGIQRFADGSTQLWHSPTVTVAAAGAKRDSLTLGLAAAALALALVLAGALVVVLARGRRAAT